MPGSLVVYGAYGYTGALVARRAAERGLAPVLAGRDSERLVAVARALGCEWRAFPLSDPEALRRGLRGAAVVVHCAGPFVHTAAPMAEACIAERVHYLDVTGEIPAFQALLALGPAARDAGVMLLPGAGFDVVPSDCLAAHLVRRLPGATSITLALGGMDRLSRGTARTMLEHAAALRGTRAGAVRTFDLGTGPVTAVRVPWADVFTAPRSTGVADVSTWLVAGAAFRAGLRILPALAPALALPWLREAVAAVLSRGSAGPSEAARAVRRSVIYGEAVDATGRRAAALQRHPDPYGLTALAAVELAARALRGEAPPGWQTPATAHGPDLVLALPGASREDL
jgi:short subunit dehydrogenase-like uncharacterized protein